jgi:LEA14-like dessication related protein
MKASTVALTVIVVIVIILALVGYQEYQQREALRDIQISVDDVAIERVDLSSATLNFSLRITNPNTNAATIDQTDYAVFINNVSLGSGQNLDRVTIPAGGSVVIPQPFTVSYAGAAQSVWTYLTQGEADWRMVGTAYFDSPLGTVSVPYELSGTLRA